MAGECFAIAHLFWLFPARSELKALARKLTPEEAKAAASRKREGEKVTIEDLEKEFQKVDDEDLMNEADGLEHVLERIELTDVERLTQQQQAAGTSEPVIELVDDTGNVVRPDD